MGGGGRITGAFDLREQSLIVSLNAKNEKGDVKNLQVHTELVGTTHVDDSDRARIPGCIEMGDGLAFRPKSLLAVRWDAACRVVDFIPIDLLAKANR